MYVFVFVAVVAVALYTIVFVLHLLGIGHVLLSWQLHLFWLSVCIFCCLFCLSILELCALIIVFMLGPQL